MKIDRPWLKMAKGLSPPCVADFFFQGPMGDVEGRELVVGGFGCPESSRSWRVRSRLPPFRTQRGRVGHPL